MPIEPHHPDLYWYGIHGVEILYTAMGSGCESVLTIHTENTDCVIGRWDCGRIGTIRGRRNSDNGYAPGFGGVLFNTRGTRPLGGFEGYEALVEEIVKFLRTGRSPVSAEETIEIYTFMEAAEKSKNTGGKRVEISSVLMAAEAAARIALLQYDISY